VGTAGAIELHRMSSPQASTAGANAPSAPAAPQMPGAAPHPAQPAPPPPGSASFSFDPPAITQPHGSTFAVNVLVAGAQNAYSVPLQVTYDSKMLQVVNVSNGTFLSQDGQAVALVHRDDDSSGTLQITATRPPGATGISGQGTVVTLTFLAKSAGQSTLAISKGGTRDPNMQPTLVAGATATVTIQ
jgi:general secretion pathway protein D